MGNGALGVIDCFDYFANLLSESPSTYIKVRFPIRTAKSLLNSKGVSGRQKKLTGYSWANTCNSEIIWYSSVMNNFLSRLKVSRTQRIVIAALIFTLLLSPFVVTAVRHTTDQSSNKPQPSSQTLGANDSQAKSNSPLTSPAQSNTPIASLSQVSSPLTSPASNSITKNTSPSTSPSISTPTAQDGNEQNDPTRNAQIFDVMPLTYGYSSRNSCSTMFVAMELYSTSSSTVTYYWKASTGATSSPQTVSFNNAATKTFNWSFAITYPPRDANNQSIYRGSISFVISAPEMRTYSLNIADPTNLCVPSLAPTPTPF